MFNYNIENVNISNNNGKKIITLTGWAFDTEKRINVDICDDKNNKYEYTIKNIRRNDVYKYFNNDNNALDSGIVLELKLKRKRISKLNIIFRDDNNIVLKNHVIDIKDLGICNIKNKLSYENLLKAFKSLKMNGLKITYEKVKNKFKNISNEIEQEEIIKPYIFIDENYEYKSIKDNNLTLVINSTNIVEEEFYIETLKKIKAQKFDRIINIYNENTNKLLVLISSEFENYLNVKCEYKLNCNKEILKFLLDSRLSENDSYYMTFNIEDGLSSSASNQIREALDTYNDKVLTFNEDRILDGEYISPLYKEDVINQKRGMDILFRKGIVIQGNKIEAFLDDKIQISDIHIIDKVLYHYRVSKIDRKSNVKPIAFYLPQYHAIPENDEWWGEGFTEWTNVRKGKPLFEGHYQPHIPGELGYYNLVEDKTIQYKQIELAKQYGVYGFCYYYYWFNGKRLLEKPLDNLLNDKGLDFPFCICWANETWSRRWDGQEKEILIKQEHNEETDIRFIEDVIPILKDDRYIRVDGAPLLLIYRAELFPNLADTIEKWKKVCRENGINELHISLVQSFGLTDPNIFNGDSAVEFPPHGIITGEISKSVPGLTKEFGGNIYDYRDVVSRYVNKRPDYYKVFRGTMLSWDNTARRGSNSNIFHYANPHEFQKWITGIIDYTTNYNDKENQYIFINAWNEWAEGTHLEPDEKYGTEYLEATKNSIYSNY